MSEISVLEQLRAIRFLDGIDDDDLQRIASVARVEEHPAGATLFREGARAAQIYLVIEGCVGLEVSVPGEGARRIHTIGAGDLLGWSPVLSGRPMTAGARTLTPVRAVAVDAVQVLALCRHDPKFGYTFMRRTGQALAARLAATRLQLVRMCGHELPLVAEAREGAD
jgi:CRP-like cAMP-binding protein